jgi:hypothetical protein
MVHQGQDPDSISGNVVQKAEGVMPQENASHTRPNGNAHLSECHDVFDRAAHLCGQGRAQSLGAVIEEGHGVRELVARGVVKGDLQPLSLSIDVQRPVGVLGRDLPDRPSLQLRETTLGLVVPDLLQLRLLLEARDEALRQSRTLLGGKLQKGTFELVDGHRRVRRGWDTIR